MMRLAAFVLASALLPVQPTRAEQDAQVNAPGSYHPRDECVSVPGAPAFLTALAEAVRQRDADALAGLSAPGIQLDFAGGEGRDEFRRRLTGEAGEALWYELDVLLELGCLADGDLIILPWFHVEELDDGDPLDLMLALGDRVPLLSEPGPEAHIERILNWQLVMQLGGGDPEGRFVHVQLIGTDATGYVEAANLRSQLDYRLVALRTGDRWRITAFVVGD